MVKYASQLHIEQNYNFVPNKKLQLNWQDLVARYNDQNGTNPCYLVALDFRKIVFLLEHITRFPKFHWTWGMRSPRSTWEDAEKKQWDEIEQFVDEVIHCLMSGCDLSFLKTLMKYNMAAQGVGNGMVYPDAWYLDPQNLVTAQNPNPAPIKVASVMAGEYSGTRQTHADLLERIRANFCDTGHPIPDALKAISEKANPDLQPLTDAVKGITIPDAPNLQPLTDAVKGIKIPDAPNLQPLTDAISNLKLSVTNEVPQSPAPTVNVAAPDLQPITDAIKAIKIPDAPNLTTLETIFEKIRANLCEAGHPIPDALTTLANEIKTLDFTDPVANDLLKHVVATLSDGKVHAKEFYTAPTGTDVKAVDSVFIKDGMDFGTGLMDATVADSLADATYTHILPTPSTPFITTAQLTANKLENIDRALRTIVAQISEHGVLSAKLPEGAHLTVPAAVPLIGGQSIRDMDGNLIPYTWTYNSITKEPVSAIAPYIPVIGNFPDYTGGLAPLQVKPTSAFLYKRFKEGAADETLASILVESLRAGVKEPNSVGKMFAVGGSYGRGIADMLATGEDITEPGWLDNLFGSTTKPEGLGELLKRALTLKDNGKDSTSLVKAFFHDNDGTPKSLATIDEQIRLILEKLKLIGDKDNILETVIAILDSVKMGREITNPLTDILTGQLGDVPPGLIDLLKNMALTKVPEGTSIGSTPVVVQNNQTFTPTLRLSEGEISINLEIPTTEMEVQLKKIADKATLSTTEIETQLKAIADKPAPSFNTTGIETKLQGLIDKPAPTVTNDPCNSITLKELIDRTDSPWIPNFLENWAPYRGELLDIYNSLPLTKRNCVQIKDPVQFIQEAMHRPWDSIRDSIRTAMEVVQTEAAVADAAINAVRAVNEGADLAQETIGTAVQTATGVLDLTKTLASTGLNPLSAVATAIDSAKSLKDIIPGVGTTNTIVANLKAIADKPNPSTVGIETKLQGIIDKPAINLTTTNLTQTITPSPIVTTGIETKLQAIADKPAMSTTGIETKLQAIADKANSEVTVIVPQQPAPVINFDTSGIVSMLGAVQQAILACCCMGGSGGAPPVAGGGTGEGDPPPTGWTDPPGMTSGETGGEITDQGAYNAYKCAAATFIIDTLLDVLFKIGLAVGGAGVAVMSASALVAVLLIYFAAPVAIVAAATMTAELAFMAFADVVIITMLAESIVAAVGTYGGVAILQMTYDWVETHKEDLICILIDATSVVTAREGVVSAVSDGLQSDIESIGGVDGAVSGAAAGGIVGQILTSNLLQLLFAQNENYNISDYIGVTCPCGCIHFIDWLSPYTTKPTGELIADGQTHTLTSGVNGGTVPHTLAFATNCESCNPMDVQIIGIATAGVAKGGEVKGCNDINQCRYNRGLVSDNEIGTVDPAGYQVSNFYGTFTDVKHVVIQCTEAFTVTVIISEGNAPASP